jgi:hypothetical protein
MSATKLRIAAETVLAQLRMEAQRNGWGTDDRFRGPDQERFRKDDGVEA